jgi:hypothetical protein
MIPSPGTQKVRFGQRSGKSGDIIVNFGVSEKVNCHPIFGVRTNH